MMDFALREEIRSCINDMKQTAEYLDQAADRMEASIKGEGLGSMRICTRMRSDANEYRKAARELSKVL